ncbi:MAG: hypothetical protein FGF51_07425 [Candidatus Brockarchaeota archaeon]|nr:hypothetical protein [Candidatus Brockarchaeota archaeon]
MNGNTGAGLIYRMHDPDVVILLFASGKLVCKSGVNEKMVYDAVEKLMAELIRRNSISLEIDV